MKRVVVAGAGGGIADGIVRALLAHEDVAVIAASRAQHRLDALRGRLDAHAAERCTTVVADAGSFAGADALAQRVERVGGCHAAVAIFGRGFWTGPPLLETPPELWHEIVDEMLTSHFAFARAMIPLLAQGDDGLYVSLGGSAAFGPVRQAALMSIAAAGQVMLTRALASENRGRPPRIVELVVEGNVAMHDPAEGSGRELTGDQVGEAIAGLVTRGRPSWKDVTFDGPLIVMHPANRTRPSTQTDRGGNES